MTKKNALMNAIETLTTMDATANAETIATLQKMVESLENARKPMSDEAKAKIAEKRKAETAAKQAERQTKIIPVLRKYLGDPITAKELYEKAKSELPADYTWNKVQSVLVRDMKGDLERIEKKGEVNKYFLK